jgi:glycosyltransferase involved in cell wall biosynthesis
MKKASVLVVYQAYLNRGGEDEVFEAEADLLEQYGHTVRRLRIEPDDLREPTLKSLPGLALQTIWSRRYRSFFNEYVAELRPDVVHFHNTFPLLSPSVYGACKEAGSAVVQTLHNYRLLCPQTNFFRDRRPCEDCKALTVPWPGVLHSCFHGSRLQTTVVASMLAFHNLRGTWHRDVDLYITPSEFAKRKFVEGGIAAERVFVKPNFACGVARHAESAGDYFLFVGRLAEPKGIPTLMEAWDRYLPDIPLRIVGDGPLAPLVQAASRKRPAVCYLGRRSHEEVLLELLGARALVFPSAWYETFGITVVEAFATARPVIASGIGPVGEDLVKDGETGLTFTPGDAADLALKVRWAWEHPEQMLEMGVRALKEYDAKYTAAANYDMLCAAYDQAMRIAAARN